MSNFSAKEIISEIEELIASNNLQRAVYRLMDFTKNSTVDRKLIREVVIISENYEDLSRNERLGINKDSLNSRKTEFLEHILLFTEIVANKVAEIEESEESIIGETAVIKNVRKLPNDKRTTIDDIREGYRKERMQQILPSSPVFVGKNISKTLKRKGATFKLNSVSLDLDLGSIVAVAGENGSGKTTFLELAGGLLKADEGILSYPLLASLAHYDNTAYSIRQQIAYIPQALPKWYGSVRDNLHFSASIHGLKGQENELEVDFIINRLGLSDFATAKWHQLSSGQKMRFALAKALIQHPKLLILDEPLANLDINTQNLFIQDLRDFANSTVHPMAILISSQHLFEIERIADNVIFFKSGEVIYNDKMTLFGQNNETNVYEIACHLSETKLVDLLQTLKPLRIKTLMIAGPTNLFHIYTSKDLDYMHIIETLHNQKIHISYFRDISNSTRRLL